MKINKETKKNIPMIVKKLMNNINLMNTKKVNEGIQNNEF